MNSGLIARAAKLRDRLVHREERIVFVESCTGGFLAASMAALPGISQWWCGSLVVYRSSSKQRWLGIGRDVLDDPAIGPVSELVTAQLARHSLERTPEARIGLAVTGDIGPGVAAEQDGRVYGCMALRGSEHVFAARLQLTRPAPSGPDDIQARTARLEEASAWVFERACEWLATDAVLG